MAWIRCALSSVPRNEEHKIEVTSTHGGRPLGKELREIKGPTVDPGEQWVARGDSIPKFLDEAVTKKVKKNYSESKQCWLVVYLNIDDYGISQKETEAAIVEVKRRYASSFEAICVLWRGQLY